MGKQRVLTICQVVGLLGVLSIAASEDSSLVKDIDYGSVQSNNILKEKCSDYPEFRPCHYWKTFVEEPNDGDKVLKCQDNCTTKDTGKREVFLEVPFLGPESQPFAGSGKRFSVYRRKNPYAQGYKRGPGFRSWGGKRSESEPEKRTKFTSWGGKREDPWDYLEPEEKRTKFANWGGKREGFDAQDKRTKFRSWGGKRTQDYPEDVSKRDAETPISYDQMEKKLWKNERELYLNEPFKKHVPKRPQFQSWGGKRTLRLWSDPLGLYYPARFNLRLFQNWDEKRKFSSWGGKRGGSDVDLDKRFGQNARTGKIPTEFKSRQIFQNWGGKRTSQEEEDDDDDDEEQEEVGDVFGVLQVPEGDRTKRQNPKTPENVPRSNFNSWGGKRGGEGEGAQR